jgi:hypothetical protein
MRSCTGRAANAGRNRVLHELTLNPRKHRSGNASLPLRALKFCPEPESSQKPVATTRRTHRSGEVTALHAAASVPAVSRETNPVFLNHFGLLRFIKTLMTS